jgi:hypothetical protein
MSNSYSNMTEAIPKDVPYSGAIMRPPEIEDLPLAYASDEPPENSQDKTARELSTSAFTAAFNPPSYSWIGAEAAAIAKDYPSVWFINFPPSLSPSERQQLRQYQQDILDYRCWASLRWWNIVFRALPSDGSEESKRRQSEYAAMIAYRDMKNTAW